MKCARAARSSFLRSRRTLSLPFPYIPLPQLITTLSLCYKEKADNAKRRFLRRQKYNEDVIRARAVGVEAVPWTEPPGSDEEGAAVQILTVRVKTRDDAPIRSPPLGLLTLTLPPSHTRPPCFSLKTGRGQVRSFPRGLRA